MIQFIQITPNHKIPLDESWLRLVRWAQNHPYSSLKLTFKDGLPSFGEECLESFKFN